MDTCLTANEFQRIEALKSFRILDTLSEREYDDITLIASQITNSPIALVSLVDEERQWFKSRVGLDVSETPRELAFCAHAIEEPTEIMVVADALEDSRFRDNPLVTSKPQIRFYAGAPLVTSEGMALGTLCVIDSKPRELTPEQSLALRALSRQVMAQLNLRKAQYELTEVHERLTKLNEFRSQVFDVAKLEIGGPIHAITGSVNRLLNGPMQKGDTVSIETLKSIRGQCDRIRRTIDQFTETKELYQA